MSDWYDEVQQGRRFRFGANWLDFTERKLGNTQLDYAVKCLKRTLDRSGLDGLKGYSFIDVGCGSGLHSAAACELGARSVVAMDYDPLSIKAAQSTLSAYEQTTDILYRRASILDESDCAALGQYDLVYSWGVLHHTGDMYRAISNASTLCAPGGIFFVSLYYPTIFDLFWKIEKRIYSSSPSWVQSMARFLWVLKTRLSFILKRRSFSGMVSSYYNSRGMDYYTNVHDWLGGYPYESISRRRCIEYVESMGFETLYDESRGGLFSVSSGCNEYVFRRLC